MVLVWGAQGSVAPWKGPGKGLLPCGRFGDLLRVRTPVPVHALMQRWLHPASNWGAGFEPGR